MPLIIGLTGQAHSGKDTTADYLVAKWSRTHRVIKVSLAAQLKVICQRLIEMFYGVIIPLESFYDLREKEAIREDLPQFAGLPFKIRTVLQLVGTEIFREMLSESVWCNYVKEHYLNPANGYEIVIISDIRMPDELAFFSKIEGWDFKSLRIVRHTREQIASANQQHKTEQQIATLAVDHEIINDSSLEDLYRLVDAGVGETNGSPIAPLPKFGGTSLWAVEWMWQ